MDGSSAAAMATPRNLRLGDKEGKTMGYRGEGGGPRRGAGRRG
jgi:hypothetical protein